MMRFLRNRRGAAGYTLIELLVVLVIAVLLLAAALPVARTVMDESRVREASRQLNSYFALARSQAISTGRPCGLLLEVNPIIGGTGSSYQVTRLYVVQSSEPYGGSTLPPPNAYVDGSNYLQFSNTTEASYLQSLVAVGDTCLVRFGYKGDWFTFVRNSTGFLLQGSLLGTTNPPGSPGQPFQVMRLPRRVGAARELPAGTAIDLLWSGMGSSGTTFDLNPRPTPPSPPLRPVNSRLMVLFGPGGEVASVSCDLLDIPGTTVSSLPPTPPAGTLHFLVGRIENAGQTGTNSNLIDPTALWVSIGRMTGAVATTENLYSATIPGNSSPTTADLVAYARQAATNREQMGGR